MSLIVPQTYPSSTEIGESDIGSQTYTSTLRTTTTHTHHHGKSSRTTATATTATTASSKQLSVNKTKASTNTLNSHGTGAKSLIDHDEIMAHVLHSILAHKTSDDKFCECLKEKPPSVQLILPPKEQEKKSQEIKSKKKKEKALDPNRYQRMIDSLSIQSDELLHAEHLWKVANEQKNLALACTTKSSKCPSVKDGLNKSNEFGRAIDWGMEKEFWMSYIPSKCKIKGFTSGDGGFWTSEKISNDPAVFKELEKELVTGNTIPPAERCARYECQLEWEVYHKLQLDKRNYEWSTDSKKNTQVKRTLAHYRKYASQLMSNVKHEQAKSLRIDSVAEGRRDKRYNHNHLDRMYKTYRILQSVEKNTQSLPPILATCHLSSSNQNKLWMNLLNRDDVLELITNSIANDNSGISKSTLLALPEDSHSHPILDHDSNSSRINPEQISCDYPELGDPQQKTPGIIWPRNISMLEIPDASM